eukprot:8142713-Lingulodinium_polyedra.AAC.1
MDWELNISKSRVWWKAQTLRRRLPAKGGGAPASTTFKDLGVVASAGPARQAPATAERIKGAIGRFGRLARLPLPFRA